jgi:hypothetical protein
VPYRECRFHDLRSNTCIETRLSKSIVNRYDTRDGGRVIHTSIVWPIFAGLFMWSINCASEARIPTGSWGGRCGPHSGLTAASGTRAAGSRNWTTSEPISRPWLSWSSKVVPRRLVPGSDEARAEASSSFLHRSSNSPISISTEPIRIGWRHPRECLRRRDRTEDNSAVLTAVDKKAIPIDARCNCERETYTAQVCSQAKAGFCIISVLQSLFPDNIGLT